MKDVIYTEDYKHKNGLTYRVKVTPDYDYGPPEKESDGHGPVIQLSFDAHDEGAVDDKLEFLYDDNDVQALEQRARYSMMRELGRRQRGHYYGRRYYDVWEALKLAKSEWGHTDDAAAQAAVDADYKYLEGWYDDDWHYITLFVYKLDENGDTTDDYDCLGGLESLMLDNNDPTQREYLVEIIEDTIASLEHTVRHYNHPHQMELDLRIA